MKKNRTVAILLCFVPLIIALAHLGIYGINVFSNFTYLYAESMVSLILLIPANKKVFTAIQSVSVYMATLILCLLFLVDFIGNAKIHNYSRYSYTESFTRFLDTMQKEYCLNSWKKMDYDALKSEYMPLVEEAEKSSDEVLYAKIISEITYRYYDSHVSVYFEDIDFDIAVEDRMAGNDYGFSMVKLSDGSVIAVLVESDLQKEDICLTDSECHLDKYGIHDGTEIVAWDGEDINEFIDRTECVCSGFEFPVKENEDIYRPIFAAGRGGETVKVTFVDDKGDVQTADIPKIGNYSNRLSTMDYLMSSYGATRKYNNMDACMLDEKYGYLRISSEIYDSLKDNIASVRHGYYPEMTELYAEKIEGLKSQGMEYLVIDIRNNGGGYDCCAGALASLFTNEKRHLVSFGLEDEKGYHVKEKLYIYPDGRYKDLPVTVLVNDSCMSAGDGMAKYLADCENVTLMGITASSGVNQNNGGCFYLTDNISVNYPIFLSLAEDGRPLIDTDFTRENRIPLDVRIPMTKDAALAMFSPENVISEGRFDYEVEYALKYLDEKEVE
ncbi:MAG: hypothetical protein K6E10_05400 [Eubacterium sp.]|nr:hypothetical protein [Eubacterium sp.]